jgi:L-serine kinase (ATP) / ParB family transcriptional regulator, heme-responsive regulator
MPTFPNLTFLPLESLVIHEMHDNQRTRPLVLRIRSSGVFRNPPIVSPLQDGSSRYMVLDGANRITALREMNFPHALVQVVEPDDPGLILQTWNHVVWELNPRRFLLGIRSIPSVELVFQPDTSAEPTLEGDCGLALIQSCRGHVWAVCTKTRELDARVQILKTIVASYETRARLDRTSRRDVQDMKEIYPGLSGLIIFPTFHIHELLNLAGSGCLLPTGITRFMISPRALHLNYPLAELAANKPIDLKNEELQRWLQDRITHKGVRYYAEATYLFDE